MKTIVRHSLWAFFKGRPLHFLPMLDGLFLPLSRPSLLPLATPPQLPQDLRDVAGVIRNSKLPLDQMPDSPQGPQRGLVAQRLRSVQQAMLQPLQVLFPQTRLAPRPPGFLQALRTLLGQGVKSAGGSEAGDGEQQLIAAGQIRVGKD